MAGNNITYLTTDGKNALALNLQDPTGHPLTLSLVSLYNVVPVITAEGNIDTSSMGEPTATSGTAAITCQASANVVQISTTIANESSYNAKTMLIFFSENSENKVFAYYTQEDANTFPEYSIFNMALKVDNSFTGTVTFENSKLDCPTASETMAGKVQFNNPPCLSDIDLDSYETPYVLRPSQVEAGGFVGTAVINPAGEGIQYIKNDVGIIQYVKNMFIKGSEISLAVDHNTTVSFTASEGGDDITGTLIWAENDGVYEAESSALDEWFGTGNFKLMDYGTSIAIFTGTDAPDFTSKTLTLTWQIGETSYTETFDSNTIWTATAGWHKALANTTGAIERWVIIPENHFSKVTITFTSLGATPEFSQVYEHIFTTADNPSSSSPSMWTLPIVPTPEAQTDYLVTAVEKIY